MNGHSHAGPEAGLSKNLCNQIHAKRNFENLVESPLLNSKSLRSFSVNAFDIASETCRGIVESRISEQESIAIKYRMLANKCRLTLVSSIS